MTDFIVHPDRGILLEGSGEKRGSVNSASSESGARTIVRWARKVVELRAQKILLGKLSEEDDLNLGSLEEALKNEPIVALILQGKI